MLRTFTCAEFLNNPFILSIVAAVGIIEFIGLGKCMEISGQLVEASEQYMQLGLAENISFRKQDRKFFKSCLPFRIKIGNAVTVAKDTFNSIVDSIVISTVIDLLVAF